MFPFLPVAYFIYDCCWCLAGVTGHGRAPLAGETPSVTLLAPLPLSPASRVPPTGPLRDGPGHFVPVLVMIFPVGMALRPVPPALPRLGAGAGDGASHLA